MEQLPYSTLVPGEVAQGKGEELKVPFLLKHTLEIEFGPVNFHNRKSLAMKLILYTYKFK